MEIKTKPETRNPKPGDFGKIGVLMGGPSSEREISLKSGKAILESLKGQGVDVAAIEINSENRGQNLDLIKSRAIDCAFLALHGYFGEDGQIQEILDELALPYTFSGPAASRLAMDKISSRRIFENLGLDVPRYAVIEKGSAMPNMTDLGFPLVVKPASQGSSIGLSIAHSLDDLSGALSLALSFDEKALVEEYLEGTEVTAGILDNTALPLVAVVPKNKMFDYQAKYQAGLTDYIVPARLGKNITLKSQEAALKAHKALGCFGCSRVDIIITKAGTPFILEVNTIPGFTQTSLLPKAAAASGINFAQLCIKLIQLAYEKA